MIHFHHWAPLGILLMLVGIAIRYKISARRFKRRTPTGLEWFSSYNKALATRLTETLVMVLARILIFVGVLLILAETL